MYKGLIDFYESIFLNESNLFHVITADISAMVFSHHYVLQFTFLGFTFHIIP